MSRYPDIASTELIPEPPKGPLHDGTISVANPLGGNESGVALRPLLAAIRCFFPARIRVNDRTTLRCSTTELCPIITASVVRRQNLLRLTKKPLTVAGSLKFHGEKLFSLRRSSSLLRLNEVYNLSVSDASVSLPDMDNSRQIRVLARSVISLFGA